MANEEPNQPGLLNRLGFGGTPSPQETENKPQKTPLPKDEITRRYKAGETAKELAVAYQTTEYMIRNLLYKTRTLRYRTNKLSEADKQEMARKYVAGAKAKSLAKEYGIAMSTLQLYMHKMKVRKTQSYQNSDQELPNYVVVKKFCKYCGSELI
jgi:Mor family transcriptional regulator